MASAIDVAVIGAGAAGIAAARRLAATGLSIIVLEASARVGGRAWTQHMAGLPLDMGCEWLHSGDRNPWTALAEQAGFAIERRPPAWDNQTRDLGFTATEQAAANAAFANWARRLREDPPASDCAADALEPNGDWNALIRANVSYISGVALENLSAADYAAYDRASTDLNWRVREGYGALIARSPPRRIDLRLATPVTSLTLDPAGVNLATPDGALRARAVIVTVSTAVLAGDSIALPAQLEPWREAARRLPLGRNEKLFVEILGGSPFELETHAYGDPRDSITGSYLIRPHGWPVIECYLGGEGAEALEREGPAAGFARAETQLASLFGENARKNLRPLAATCWSRMDQIGGAYSSALPGCAAARRDLARPFDGRVFFAGEATETEDFSTAHGAYASGLRAAGEAIAALA